MRRLIFKESESVQLRPLTQSDFYLLLYWRSIKDNAKWFNSKDICYDSHNKWFSNYNYSFDDYTFIAETKDTEIPIGMVSIYHINYNNKSAEFGRLLLAHPDYRGMGLGKEISELAINIAFNELNINKLYLEVHTDNTRAHNIYLSLGFKDMKIESGNYIMELLK